MTNNGFRLELVEPFVGKADLWKTLKARPGLYHMAFEVTGSSEYLRSWAHENGLFATISERAAVAFPGAMVSFFLARDGSLIEVIRKNPAY